jgi:hypothetical protein
MRYVEAPEEFEGNEDAIFLAGGISGCFDWQSRVAELLADSDLAVLNPRRRGAFAMDDAALAREQIAWEFRHLRRAWGRLFWFPPETLCPIALFELGAWSKEANAPLFVGTDPKYARRFDVVEQLRLARPEVRVVDSVEALAAQVIACRNARTPKETTS